MKHSFLIEKVLAKLEHFKTIESGQNREDDLVILLGEDVLVNLIQMQNFKSIGLFG
jgi:hypothetical protein